MDCTKTLKLRIKDKHAKVLRQIAREVNQVWNHINAISAKAARPFDGDVASSKLVKTKMAKSTLDAGWAMLKTMLEYKSHQAAIVFEVVNESYTTQTCSCCGVITASSPKGRAGLRIREWVCSACGAAHDRDTNAAKNILAAFRAGKMSNFQFDTALFLYLQLPASRSSLSCEPTCL